MFQSVNVISVISVSNAFIQSLIRSFHLLTQIKNHTWLLTIDYAYVCANNNIDQALSTPIQSLTSNIYSIENIYRYLLYSIYTI